MKLQTLNLSNKKHSDINFEVRSFPDGQQDIFLDKPSVGSGTTVVITSRFNSFRDLELIICATQALRNLDVETIELNIPYILGARSDRQFSEGGTSYLVQVVAPILNSLNFKKVYSLDAHSNIASACINRLRNKSNIEFVADILKAKDNYILVSPDAGAKEKVYNIAKSLKHDKDIRVCSKVRDAASGRIVDTYIGPASQWGQQDIYIVDDICDGGRTFIEIAKKIRQYTTASINLIVTHGIFSNGLGELKTYFNNIYSTNSINDFPANDFLHQTKII